MNDLMVSGFIEHENQEIFLVENEETGKSELMPMKKRQSCLGKESRFPIYRFKW